MEIVCQGCGARLSVPDDKLPAKGAAQATCPKCKGKLVIGAKAAPRAEPAAGAPGAAADSSSSAYSSGLLERFEEGVAAALVVFEAGEAAAAIERALAELGYRPTLATDVEDACARIKFNTYELVVVQAGLGTAAGGRSPMLEFLDTLPMSVRRQMFVVLVGPGLETLDRMAAFMASVNMVVSEADSGDLGKILKNSVAEHELFYRVFNETLKGLGRS